MFHTEKRIESMNTKRTDIIKFHLFFAMKNNILLNFLSVLWQQKKQINGEEE